ncbi:unnamed protein product, partial [Amoebophrya sp. A120]
AEDGGKEHHVIDIIDEGVTTSGAAARAKPQHDQEKHDTDDLMKSEGKRRGWKSLKKSGTAFFNTVLAMVK